MTPPLPRLAARSGDLDRDPDSLDDDALDGMPVGVVAIDAAGKVVRYNRPEAERAGLSRWRAVGRDFQRELAWTIGGVAAERVRAFVARGGCSDAFRTRVALRTGVHDLEISLRRARDGLTYVVIQFE